MQRFRLVHWFSFISSARLYGEHQRGESPVGAVYRIQGLDV
jgi:hypothetical protein